MISFDNAIREKQEFIVAPGCKTEARGFFTNCRVNRSTIPSDWNAYDIRHGDDGSFCTVEPNVVINHGGTFLTKNKVKMNKGGYHSLRGRGGYTFI